MHFMNKHFLFFSIFLLNTLMLLSIDNSDELLSTLYKKAENNLKNLPSYCKSNYQKLLKQHPDRLMCFLLAYEENGRLATVESQIILDHWISVQELMHERGINKPDEFFLSYIAKLTVSDESISNYRPLFEQKFLSDGITPSLNLKALRNSNHDPFELYRIAMLKTNEYLRYKPTSGRDQNPLDVVTKSLYGRCEEWQITFIAICRTLGLPARPASTPWWAHQDDNHAWSEIFINGAWHYDGDYYPDQNWFSGLADKMVIITADGSLPSPDDEVLSQDEYGAVINSIKFYAGEKTRKISIKVTDLNANPLPNCPVSINVYNTNGIRPQAYTLTDIHGEKIISVGQGAFYLIAHHDSLTAMQFVPSGGDLQQHYSLTLNKTNLDQQNVKMNYPNKKINFIETPQIWKDNTKLANDAWQNRADLISPMIRKALIDDNEQLVLNNHADSLFYELLRTSRFNMQTLLTFKEKYATETLNTEWLNLLLENDEKDLWQTNNPEFLKRMYNWFNYIYPQVANLQKEEILNLLNPTVLYENLPWQSPYLSNNKTELSLYPKSMIINKPKNPSPNQVIALLTKNHKINNKKAIKGLIPLETALHNKYLTNYQFKILAVNYLRANKIPADYTRIANVVSVFTDHEWHYYDLIKNEYYHPEKKLINANSAMRKITIDCLDEDHIPIALDENQIKICFLKDGQLFLNNQQSTYLGNGRFSAEIPQNGDFYLQCAYRQSDSLTVYKLQPLFIENKPLDQINIVCNDYPKHWNSAENYLLPITNELDKRSLFFSIIGNYTLENTLRMAAKLNEYNKKFLVIGHTEGKVDNYEYTVLNEYLELIKQIPSLSSRTITLIKNPESGQWQMYEGLWNKLP